MKDNQGIELRVAVVGACSAGKSTLVAALKEAGFEARHVAQEHSFVPAMWEKVTDPDVLIYLDVNYESVMSRWPNANFKPADLEEQNRRLSHAKANCDLYIDTSVMSQGEVKEEALQYLLGLFEKDSTSR